MNLRKLNSFLLVLILPVFSVGLLNAQDPGWSAVRPDGDPGNDFSAFVAVTVNGQAIDASSTLAILVGDEVRGVGPVLGSLDGRSVFNINAFTRASGPETGNFSLYDAGRGLVLTLEPASPVTLESSGALGDTSTNTPAILTFTAPTQPISFPDIASRTYGDPTFELNASSGVDTDAITYASGNTSVATVVGNVVTILGAGQAQIIASLAGTDDVAKTLSVSPKSLTVTGASASDKQYDGSTLAAVTGGTLNGIINSLKSIVFE